MHSALIFSIYDPYDIMIIFLLYKVDVCLDFSLSCSPTHQEPPTRIIFLVQQDHSFPFPLVGDESSHLFPPKHLFHPNFEKKNDLGICLIEYREFYSEIIVIKRMCFGQG